MHAALNDNTVRESMRFTPLSFANKREYALYSPVICEHSLKLKDYLKLHLHCYQASWFTQFRALTWRNALAIFKEPVLIKARFGQAIVSIFFISTSFNFTFTVPLSRVCYFTPRTSNYPFNFLFLNKMYQKMVISTFI